MALVDSQYRSEEENCKNSQVVWVVKSYTRLAAMLIAVIFNSSCEANMITKEDVVFFSRVQGTVLFKGVPVANAKVIRRYTFDTPSPLEDSCLTDGNGMFSLPVISKKDVRLTPLVQFVVHQEMYVDYDGVRHEIWLHGKMDKAENSEYGGEFKNISCELTEEAKRKEVGRLNVLFTNCIW